MKNKNKKPKLHSSTKLQYYILNVQKKKPVFHECRVLLAIIITV